jgi:hypothetical protein
VDRTSPIINLLFADNSNVFPANGHPATHLEPTFYLFSLLLNLDILSVQLVGIVSVSGANIFQHLYYIKNQLN